LFANNFLPCFNKAQIFNGGFKIQTSHTNLKLFLNTRPTRPPPPLLLFAFSNAWRNLENNALSSLH
jgi:hypothetical protein